MKLELMEAAMEPNPIAAARQNIFPEHTQHSYSTHSLEFRRLERQVRILVSTAGMEEVELNDEQRRRIERTLPIPLRSDRSR